jgi:hypothetical protein
LTFGMWAGLGQLERQCSEVVETRARRAAVRAHAVRKPAISISSRGPGEPGRMTRAGRTTRSYGWSGETRVRVRGRGSRTVFAENVLITSRGRPSWPGRRNRCAARFVRASLTRTSS